MAMILIPVPEKTGTIIPLVRSFLLNGLDLEMKPDEREYEAFEVLDEVVETSEGVRVLAVVYVDQRSDL